MKERLSNQLSNNLLQLQNLIKRDALSYKDEFLLQHRYYKTLLTVFQLKPNERSKCLEDVVTFLSQVSHCFPEELKEYSQEIITLLEQHRTKLNPETRLIFCRALVLLRNKGLLTPTDLLKPFFNLLKCQDKHLRKFIEIHIINDIKNVNSKHKNAKTNSLLQNFMFQTLKESHSVAAKTALDILIDLYLKNVWNDARTVNFIATACFSKITKVLVAALNFFLGNDKEDMETDSESEAEDVVTPRDVAEANKVNKKSRKRKKLLERSKKMLKKRKTKSKAPSFNFSAIHLINDPQGMAEKLFKSLETMNERFEVKLMVMNLISRLIGIHQLFVFNFYPYLIRYVQPHQRDVTKILQFIAQASHDLVPPENLEPLVKAIANNFVTERNASEVMAVGLNAIRELCLRCPLAMNEDLLQDLANYKSYRERSVIMAARSLIQLFRTINPQILKKRMRGKPTEATEEIIVKQYGESEAKDYIAGAEVLEEEAASSGEDEPQEEDVDSDGSWIEIPHSDDEAEVQENPKKKPLLSLEEKIDRATLISQTRILTQADFKKLNAAQLSKQVSAAAPKSKTGKRKLLLTEELDSAVTNRGELVSIHDIERVHKRRQKDKESRLETVLAGREGREKFGQRKQRLNPFASRPQREKNKNKAFMMIKYKVMGKAKRSFRDKQISLRNALLKQKKRKH